MNKLQISLIAITAIVAGVWLGQLTTNNSRSSIKTEAIQGAIYPKAKEIKDFNLINQDSSTITKADFKHHWSLIFIGYTHCPDVCPTTLAVMNQVHQLMSTQQLQPPKIVFLSVDPERDTVETLKPYIHYFNKSFIALTGSLDEVTRLSLQLNSRFMKAAGASGDITKEDYLMDHSSALLLMNPDGNLQSVLTAPHAPKTIIDSINKSRKYYLETH